VSADASTAAGRRAYAAALLLLVGGAVALFVAFGLPWATADVPLLSGSTEAVRAQGLTGRDLFPGAAMAAWIALASVAGVVATRSWGRIVVGVLATLAGAAAVASALVFVASSAAVVDAHVGEVVGSPVSVVASVTPAWVLAALGGGLVVSAGGWTALRGTRWPVLGSRYERNGSASARLSPWDAQDAGRDPTDDLVE
jgi:uncharacterized membrane protein (TIGR02234 family)